MEFICRFHDRKEMQRVRHLLRSKGIASYCPQVEGMRLGEQWALFVRFSAQAEDARRIIRDPRHQPKWVVDAALVERALDNPVPGIGLAKWMGVIAVLLLVAVSGLVYFTWRFS